MSTEATKPEKLSYKQTLNLPQTSFPMEAKLTANEPARLKAWEDAHLYETIQTARAKTGKGKWILHDGPPFANGDIHIGHVINKTLKDVILKFRTMQGYQTPYVPGWDCHGLPIEHKIQELAKDAKEKLHELGVVEVRRRCYEYAGKYVGVQAEQFKRLGILGDWEHPYKTMGKEYEASTLEVFAKFVEAGLVYRKLKPVPWSIANQTALADAELEYQDVDDNSVYVEFQAQVTDDLMKLAEIDENEPVYFLVWTTTPWTLPANLAIAVNPAIEYAFIRYLKAGDLKPRVGVVARELIKSVFSRSGIEQLDDLGGCNGSMFFGDPNSFVSGIHYSHPFLSGLRPIVGALYVTTMAGTGLVHTAPGHGDDDYETGLRVNLPAYSPVLANGRFDDTVPEWLRGKPVLKDGNALIVAQLKESGHLFGEQTIRHSYPHDWRSKTPIITRATEQWFVNLDLPISLPSDPPGLGKLSLKQRAGCVCLGGYPHRTDRLLGSTFATLVQKVLAFQKSRTPEENDVFRVQRGLWGVRLISLLESGGVVLTPFERAIAMYVDNIGASFVPKWGETRLYGMLQSRPDWCVSRQRAWGLPIPVFYNERGDALLTPASVRAVAKRVGELGSDVWFNEEPATLLGSDFVYPPGFTPTNLRKEKDIFDVWFESGSSWHAVLQARDYLQFPADLYLEGSDQHRGWFQLSLLPSLGATGQPPFKQVLTHGFVVKPDGTKVSKSDKEYVTATKEINTHGADVLRLWCCSVDYQNDIPASPKALQEFGDKYRKIRNTLRYLLSNLYDFPPAPPGLPASAGSIPQNSLDGWILNQLDTLIIEVTAAYDTYQLHRAFRLLHDFCSVQISSIYGNAMKDRLYCEAADAPLRRRCQAVMHKLALALSKLLAPMIVFTADEAWCHLPHKPADEAALGSVHVTLLPEASKQLVADELKADWDLLMQLRESALGQLDELKKTVGLNKASEAEVEYHLPADVLSRFKTWNVDLEDAVGAGNYVLVQSDQASVKIIDARTRHAACARCWKRRPGVNAATQLCERCTAALPA